MIVTFLTFAWSLWLRVPFVPSSDAVVQAACRLGHLQPGECFYDLGSGDGRTLVAAARCVPGVRLAGCEHVPTLWLIGRARLWWAGLQADVRWGEPQGSDLQRVDLLFLYLTPSALAQLLPTIEAGLRPGTRVVCHTFMLPGRSPVASVACPSLTGRHDVFAYVW